MTNCKNCGMPLSGGVCEYCGTRYDLIDTRIKPTQIYEPSIISIGDLSGCGGLLTITHLDDGIEYTISGDGGVLRWNNKGISYGEIH